MIERGIEPGPKKRPRLVGARMAAPPCCTPIYLPPFDECGCSWRKEALSARGHNRDGREIRRELRKKGRCALGGEEVLASLAFASACNGVEQPRSDAYLGTQGFHRTSRRETWRSCPFEKFVCRHGQSQAEGGLRSRAIWPLPATAPPPLRGTISVPRSGGFRKKERIFVPFRLENGIDTFR